MKFTVRLTEPDYSMAKPLSRIHTRTFLAVLLWLGIAGGAGYFALSDSLRSAQQEIISHTADAAATRINDLIAHQRQAIERFARQTAVVNILQRGNSPERERKQEEIESLIADASAAYLLPMDRANLSAAPRMEPACRDFARRALASDKPSPPEFHALGTPAEHYDLAAPVHDVNNKLFGYLLVSFPRAPLQAVIEQSLPSGGRMELQQPVSGERPRSLVTVGEIPLNVADVETKLLNNNSWALVYLPSPVAPAMLSGIRPYFFAVMALATLMLASALLHLRRRAVQAVRHDIKSLIRMFRDIREKTIRVDYPMELQEFSDVFNYLRNHARKLVEEREKLKGMGLIDHLSQLSNRRHFEQRLAGLFETCKSNGPSSVLIIDVDHFKKVNDEYGHDAGDALIVGFAKALSKVVRQSDVLARLGGDEFCIIYTYAPLEKAQSFAERLRRELPREIPLTKGVMHKIRWTGGLSVMHDSDTKPDEVLWRADQALIQAKTAGRNITKIHHPVSGLVAKRKIISG